MIDRLKNKKTKAISNLLAENYPTMIGENRISVSGRHLCTIPIKVET